MFGMYPIALMTATKYGSTHYLCELLEYGQYPLCVLEEAVKQALAVRNGQNAMIIMSFILSREDLTEEYAYE